MKKLTTLFLLALLPLMTSAQTLINGLYYKDFDLSTKTCALTRGSTKHTGSITIPSSVTYSGSSYSVTAVDEGAFYYCTNLASVSIPKTVTSIGSEAFSGCTGLKSITIPNSVTKIGYGAFSGCSGLTSLTIPNSVTKIESSAFSDCSGLTSVTIPNSVTIIESSTFNGCSSLTSIEIPNSVTSIGSYAFSGCSVLTSVTIPSSVTEIGQSAFNNCTGLKKVNITDLAAWCKISFSSGSNPLSYAGHLFLNDREITDLVIPDGLSSIGDWTFSNCSNFTSVTIPSSVTSIGICAFYGCTGLKKVNITDLTAWCKIGFPMIPGGGGASPLSYAGHLFLNGKEITELVIPDDVGSTGSFYGCIGLKSVTIPNNVTRISYYAFSECSNLTTVTIGDGVTYIGIGAFANCPKLMDLYCYARKGPETGSDVFLNSKVQFGTLHVPALSVNGYSTTEPWSGFGNVIAIEDGTQPPSPTPASISLNYTSLNLTVGDTRGLTASVFPSGASQSVTWSVVSGSNYVSVDSSGQVTAKDAGTAIVRATSSENGSVYKECTIMVQKPVTEGIAINETNFPDENFRNWILSQEYGQDGYITEEEIANITTIEVDEKNIQSLKGIEFFVNLTSLICKRNQITSLDVSKNLSLIELQCDENQLTSIDISKNVLLESLDCEGNQLMSLDLSENVALKYLYCQSNQLTSLDVSKCKALKELHCKGNLLTSLDVSNCASLKDLSCYNNKLATLNVSGCTALEEFSCHNNQLTSLDVSGFTALKYLSCYSNQLTSLNVSNTALRELSFYGNQIKDGAMDAFIASLPTVTNGQLYAIFFKNEGNMMTSAQEAAAKAKGWKTYICIRQYYSEGGMLDDGYYDYWQEYAGSEPIPTEKCATPTISYVNGNLQFDCETEGVEFVYDVKCNDAVKGVGTTVSLTKTYIVSVYAKKEGLEDSDVVTKEINISGTGGLRGDVNNDGQVGMPDAMFIVNKILNGKFPDE